MSEKTTIIYIERKSIGLALLLAIIFGPLGMLYSTVAGALIMLVITGVLAVLTLGLSLVITWPVCVLWSGLAAWRAKRRVVRIA
jgi:hypothetical protein